MKRTTIEVPIPLFRALRGVLSQVARGHFGVVAVMANARRLLAGLDNAADAHARTVEIFKETQDAIDSLGRAHDDPLANPDAVDAVISGPWGVDQESFARALLPYLHLARQAPAGERRDAILRATGLAGRRDPYARLRAYVEALEGFGVSRAEALRRAAAAGTIPQDYDEAKMRARIAGKRSKFGKA